jgi:hypothetical protein
VWDFQRETVVVLDPMSMHLGGEHMIEKHKGSVTNMHQALEKCMQIYFSGINVSMKNWDVQYVTVVGAEKEG